MLYLIEILHQTTTISTTFSMFNPLYLIEILHQTTTASDGRQRQASCILLKFYIKPQQEDDQYHLVPVVSYWNSTSNHNLLASGMNFGYVVSYWNSTSNHNPWVSPRPFRTLYLIEILHQTTTTSGFRRVKIELYLIEILHQTTTTFGGRQVRDLLYLIEILHQTTTLMLLRLIR